MDTEVVILLLLPEMQQCLLPVKIYLKNLL